MKKIKCIITNEHAEHFWEEQEYEAQRMSECMHSIKVYPQVRYQKVDGFGGAFTEASAYNYCRMGTDNQREMIEAYYGDSGLRYNIGRIHMNSCDFAVGNYTYVRENDEDLSSFQITHDEKEILPFIYEAMDRAGQTVEFLVSPWSPPAYMKTNNEMNHGGKLKKEYYRLWAEYFVKFIQEYKKRGVTITAVTVQNEPEAVQTWDSCIYTAEEESEFVADYLGPALEQAGLSEIAIYVWDHNKEELMERFTKNMENEKAAKYIAGAAVHWYTGDHFEAIEMARSIYPDKKIIFTEGCVEYSRFADTKETQKAEMYAHDIMGNLNAGLSAYLDWNLFLDQNGGPNHVGNFCAAPIMCNTTEDTFEKRLTYYYIGQFSRYIKKGAVRIGTTRYTDDLEVSGYLNPDGGRSIVVMNKSNLTKEITLSEDRMGIMTSLEPHSIATFCYSDEK